MHSKYIVLEIPMSSIFYWYTFFRFNPAELGFLAEYTAVMKPIAMALNILQGESSVHMGFLLPTLYQLQEKLKRLELSCKMCRPLPETFWRCHERA